MTTANVAGTNSRTPRAVAQLAIMNPHLPWYLVIPSFLENSVPLSKPSAKGASSKLPRAGSPLEAAFARLIRANKWSEPAQEYRFDTERRWRFDFAWIREKIAVEMEGGTWSGGRHTTGSGFRADCEKYNEAQLQGWIVLRFTADDLKDGNAERMTARALGL